MAGDEDEYVGEDEESPIRGDVLETILSHVPLIDLMIALQVSKSWNGAVFSSLRSLRPPKPWLILHSQDVCPPHATSTCAYDPRSHVWIKISQSPNIEHFLRSSHSNLLYMLCPSKLSFSFDPLNATWHHVDPPGVWRVDPIVAKVGDSILVAGGACDFERDPLAVEIYDINGRKWRKCNSMPGTLKDSASSTWVSTAATSKEVFVMEKQTGLLHVFDLKSNDWSGPYDLRPDQRCFNSVIGCVGEDRLILVGIIMSREDDVVEKVEKVGIWEVAQVGCGSFDSREIGEMPLLLAQKLNHGTFGTSSVNICLGGSSIYIYNPVGVEEMVVCELMNGRSGCRWSSMRYAAACGGRMARLVFTCAEVKVEDLQRARRLKNWRFEEITSN